MFLCLNGLYSFLQHESTAIQVTRPVFLDVNLVCHEYLGLKQGAACVKSETHTLTYSCTHTNMQPVRSCHGKTNQLSICDMDWP